MLIKSLGYNGQWQKFSMFFGRMPRLFKNVIFQIGADSDWKKKPIKIILKLKFNMQTAFY